MQTRTFSALRANPIQFGFVTVRVGSKDGPLATGLKKEDGSDLSNPFPIPKNGRPVFQAPNGNYWLNLVGPGFNLWEEAQFIDVADVLAVGNAKEAAEAAAESAAESAAEAEGKVLAFKEQELGYFTRLIGDGDSLVSFLEAGGSVDIGYVARVNAVDDSAEVIPSDWKCTDTDGELPGGATPGELYEGKLYVQNEGDDYYVFEYVGEGRVDEQTGAVVTLRNQMTSGEAVRDFLSFERRSNGLSGTIAVLMQTLLQESISVTQYGAIGDGTSHPLSEMFSSLALAQIVYPHAVSLDDEIDWAAIQGAINDNPGRAIRAPASPGYVVNRPVVIKTDDTIFHGDGRKCSLLLRNSDFESNTYGNNTLVVANAVVPEEGGVVGANPIRRCAVYGLGMISTVQMMTVGAHLYTHAAQDCIFRDLWLENGDQAMHHRSMSNCFIKEIHIFADHDVMTTTRGGNTKAVIFSFSRGNFKNNTGFVENIFVRSTFPPSHSKGYDKNLVIESADGLWIRDSYFGAAATYNCLIEPRVSAASSQSAAEANKIVGLQINNTWFDYSTGILVRNNQNEYATIRNVSLFGNTYYGYAGFGSYAVVLDADRAEDIKITGPSRAHDFNLSAIDVRKGKRWKIDGFTARQCNRAGLVNTGCINVNTSNAADGPTDWSIRNCDLGHKVDGTTAQTTHGVLIGQNCDNFEIEDNVLTGNGAALFNGSSGGSVNRSIRNNRGYITRNQGIVTITSGVTSWVITHGLSVTPLGGDINITLMGEPTNDMGSFWVSNITSTQFTLNWKNAAGNTPSIRWKIEASG